MHQISQTRSVLQESSHKTLTKLIVLQIRYQESQVCKFQLHFVLGLSVGVDPLNRHFDYGEIKPQIASQHKGSPFFLPR
jgi:hypothetical protein